MYKLVTALIKLPCQHAYKVLICDIDKLYQIRGGVASTISSAVVSLP
jgi:hypothetical protein